MFKTTDPLMGSSRGTPEAAIARIKANGGVLNFAEIVTELYRCCLLIGIDFALVIAQMIVETGWFGTISIFWTRDGNTGGIGIDGDNSGNSVSQSPWGGRLSAKDAVHGHLAVLWIKIHGADAVLPDAIKDAETGPGAAYLKNVRAFDRDGHWPGVTTVDDLNTHFVSTITGNTEATWAWDETYQDLIVARAASLFPDAPDHKAPEQETGGTVIVVTEPATKLVFGRVQHPGYEKRIILDAQNSAWNDLGKRAVVGVVLHRQYGYNHGTDTYFREMADARQTENGGLTDYGVDRNTAELLMWNDPLGAGGNVSYGAYNGLPGYSGYASPDRAPWASGPWMNPPGDGIAFVAKYGVNGINRLLTAIEIDGLYDDPVGPACWELVAQLIAYWADQNKIPWDVFPLNPQSGLTFIYWHSEFQNEKPCPGDVVRAGTTALIARVKAILKEAQVVAATTDTGTYPDHMDHHRAERAFGVFKARDKRSYGFNIDGKVSRAWLAEGAKTHRFPRLIDMEFLPDQPGLKGRVDFYFEGGLIITTASGQPALVRG